MKVSVSTKRPILSPCGLKDIEYQVDTYIGCEHYCYYCYALPHAETDWSKEILIHKDIVDQLDQELDKIAPQTIYLGYQTDPYQPCENDYCQTRKVLELLFKRGFSASILTKSDLVVRDIDILKEMNDAAVSVSVAFKNNKTRKLFEANTIETKKRITALQQLKEAGVRTGTLLCPIIPYITETLQLIDMLEPYADVIWIYGLVFNDRSAENWLNVEEILNCHFSTLLEKIEPILFSKEHRYWAELGQSLETLRTERKLNLNIHI